MHRAHPRLPSRAGSPANIGLTALCLCLLVCVFRLCPLQTHCQVSREKVSASSFVRVVRQQGLPRMWRGAPLMFAGCIPSHAAYFSVYEQVCLAVFERLCVPHM